ncbi:MAG TPA: hypothetical protein VHX59_24500 [Mycobacteriales bacterium]|jgi:hypothetical protein|nr:hypothetical protein [Mycobacteriales bacterium]
MINNFVFDATQAEVAYRIDNLYQTRRNLRLQKRHNVRWFGRRAGVAQRPVQEQVRAPAPIDQSVGNQSRHQPVPNQMRPESASSQPRHEPVAKEKSEVSVG